MASSVFTPHLLRRWALVGLLVLHGGPALAQSVAPTPDLPPADLARSWIDRDPAVQEALRQAAAAGHAGAALAAGPHEWTARATAQQRRVRDSGERSQEWNIGIERGVRVGRKADLDRQLGQGEARQAHAHWQVVRMDAARTLAELWLARQSAEQALTLARQQVETAQTQLGVVHKRRRAGDASLLEQHAAEADLAEARRLASLQTTQARKAELRLRERFPDATPVQRPPMSDPIEPAGPLAQWQERIAAVSEALRLARMRVTQADLSAQRASADRVADPVLGVYTAQESFRTERLVGVSVSLPLGGAQRRAVERQRLQEADAWRLALERTQRELHTAIAETHTDAVDGVQRWTLAEEAARAAAEAARLMRRAYELGENDLQSALLARRHAMETARAALDARTEALRAHHRLLIDAHLVWPPTEGAAPAPAED